MVVVPSTCKLPLMITSPSLLNPSGYGSMNILFSAPSVEEIIFSLILIFPKLPIPGTLRDPPMIRFFSIPTPPS